MTIKDLEQRIEKIRESHQAQIIKIENHVLNTRQRLNKLEDDLANHGIGCQEK